MTEYEEHWITTYTGKKFHYLDPQPEEICIEDIAHALSLACRFSGHCRVHYSVAEHSIRLADIVSGQLKLQALLHDSAEAYITDIPRPVKNTFGLRPVEEKILTTILNKFGVSGISPVVRKADNILIATEARDLMPDVDGWATLPEPLPETIHPYVSHEYAEQVFLLRFEMYGGK